MADFESCYSKFCRCTSVFSYHIAGWTDNQRMLQLLQCCDVCNRYLEHRPATVQCAKFMSRRKSDVRKRNFLRRPPGLVSKRYTAQYFLYILEAFTYQER